MKSRLFSMAILALSFQPAAAREPSSPHNVIIFVADGLRYGSVVSGNMPNMTRLKRRGVDFINSHSLYPTVTTVNASAIATGHYIGDTGDFGNVLYTGQPMDSAKGSMLPFLENDAVLAEMNSKFGGNYLGETTLLAAARASGWQTAAIGKVGPTRIQDATAAPDGSQTLIVDDSTGQDGGLGLPSWFSTAMKQAFVDEVAPKTSVPNIEQEVWETKLTTRIVLPHFRDSGKPFALLFWSRDPDISQHNGRDSIGETAPGINGPTGNAGTRDADTELGELLSALKRLGLDKTTDVFVTADHGFATVSHDDQGRDLPSGFLATDLAQALSLQQPTAGVLGADPSKPDVVIAGNAGSDIIYLPGDNASALASRIIDFLEKQDYVSGIFVNDNLGQFPGALAMSDVGLMGSAQTPKPAIYVSFRTFSVCKPELQCTVQMGDTPLLTGQGNHGSFSRAETRNFMVAFGPDFKSRYVDPAPISNADIAPTLAHIMGLMLLPKGKLTGRTISEAIVGGKPVRVTHKVIVSDPSPEGIATVLDEQRVHDTRYFDAAGAVGRTVGLKGQ